MVNHNPHAIAIAVEERTGSAFGSASRLARDVGAPFGSMMFTFDSQPMTTSPQFTRNLIGAM